jgi:hypothetical protein
MSDLENLKIMLNHANIEYEEHDSRIDGRSIEWWDGHFCIAFYFHNDGTLNSISGDEEA